MVVVGLLAAVMVGLLGWSGWLAIPAGALMFFGSLRALPQSAGRISAAGLPFYMIMALLIILGTDWLHDRFF